MNIESIPFLDVSLFGGDFPLNCYIYSFNDLKTRKEKKLFRKNLQSLKDLELTNINRTSLEAWVIATVISTLWNLMAPVFVNTDMAAGRHVQPPIPRSMAVGQMAAQRLPARVYLGPRNVQGLPQVRVRRSASSPELPSQLSTRSEGRRDSLRVNVRRRIEALSAAARNRVKAKFTRDGTETILQVLQRSRSAQSRPLNDQVAEQRWGSSRRRFSTVETFMESLLRQDPLGRYQNDPEMLNIVRKFNEYKTILNRQRDQTENWFRAYRSWDAAVKSSPRVREQRAIRKIRRKLFTQIVETAGNLEGSRRDIVNLIRNFRKKMPSSGYSPESSIGHPLRAQLVVPRLEYISETLLETIMRFRDSRNGYGGTEAASEIRISNLLARVVKIGDVPIANHNAQYVWNRLSIHDQNMIRCALNHVHFSHSVVADPNSTLFPNQLFKNEHIWARVRSFDGRLIDPSTGNRTGQRIDFNEICAICISATNEWRKQPHIGIKVRDTPFRLSAEDELICREANILHLIPSKNRFIDTEDGAEVHHLIANSVGGSASLENGWAFSEASHGVLHCCEELYRIAFLNKGGLAQGNRPMARRGMLAYHESYKKNHSRWNSEMALQHQLPPLPSNTGW